MTRNLNTNFSIWKSIANRWAINSVHTFSGCLASTLHGNLKARFIISQNQEQLKIQGTSLFPGICASLEWSKEESLGSKGKPN